MVSLGTPIQSDKGLPSRVTEGYSQGALHPFIAVLPLLGLPLSHLVLPFLGFLSVSFHALSTLYKVLPLLSLHSSHFMLPNLVSVSLIRYSLPLMQGLPLINGLHASLVWCSDSPITYFLRVLTVRAGMATNSQLYSSFYPQLTLWHMLWSWKDCRLPISTGLN